MKTFEIIAASTGLILSILLGFYFACLNHVNPLEIGVAYDSQDGQVTLQTNAGWYVTSPFVKVINVPLTPIKVGYVTSAVVNPIRIVRIKPDHVLDLFKLQGYSYSWGTFDQLIAGYVFCSSPLPNFLEEVKSVQ